MKRFLWALSGIISAFLIAFNSGFTASAYDIDIYNSGSFNFLTTSRFYNTDGGNSTCKAKSLGGVSGCEFVSGGVISHIIFNLDKQLPGGSVLTFYIANNTALSNADERTMMVSLKSFNNVATVLDVQGVGNVVNVPSAIAGSDNVQAYLQVKVLLNRTGTQFGLYVANQGKAPMSIAVLSGNYYRMIPPTETDVSGVIGAINSGNTQAHQDAQAALQDQQKQTAAIEETKDFVTDTSTPEAGDIVNSDSLPSVGLLPAGPLDSILLLPVNILNSIIQSFGGTCQPVIAPLPFTGGEEITFPCFSDTFYSGSFSTLATLIGGVASAFILYKYFKYLYKKVDRAVSLETTDEDEWGIL